ncbi:MAG: hypothetical protein KC417_13060, partial [Myxococcales bacterium]|nr:hypothetical protein [Myxococcales bacterium]
MGDNFMVRRSTFVGCAAVVASFLFVPAVALGGSTRSFEVDDADAFGKGEIDGASVSSSGTLRMGVSKERVALDKINVAWCALQRKDGSLLVGTGNEGRVYRVSGKDVSIYAETKQLLVTALAEGPDGAVYASTLPEARGFRIDGAGKVKEIARIEKAAHIWALVWDPGRKALLAGTGPEGQVVSITPAGAMSVVYDDEATHILSIARDRKGDVYVGTSNAARVLRLKGDGKAEVVYDLPGNEITALAVRDGEVLATANAFEESKTTDDKKKGTTTPGPRSGDGQVWRISPDGRADRLFEQRKDFFTHVGFGEQGSVYAASGKEGRLFRIDADHNHAKLVDLDEHQIQAFDLSGSTPYVLASDAAAVYWVKPGKASPGQWTSDVLDAEAPARFGELTWRSIGPVEFQTRSGNTEKPNDTWTAWSAPMATPGPVRSPGDRYLQVRATLKDPTSVVYAITAYYLRHNQQALVTQVSVEPKGSSDKDKDSAAGPKPTSVYKISWKTENPDGDPLRYYLRFRSEGRARARDILPPHVVQTATSYEWDTASIPDGYYVIEVDASDETVNPPELALRTTTASEPMLIDNHAPAIVDLAVSGRRVTGRAEDSLGPIARLEFAVDGGAWQVFFPSDGIFDTRKEAFAFDLPAEETKGRDHIIAVRATDAGGNV